MIFSFNLKSSLLLFFVLHGLVFSMLLISRGLRLGNKADAWLAIFLLLCTLYVCPFMLGYAGWYSGGIYREILFYTPFQQLLLIPPVLYIYINFLLFKDFKFKKRHLLHFLPAAAYFLYSLIIFIVDILIFERHVFYADQRDKDFSSWYQFVGFISLLTYVIATLKTYQRYRKNIYDSLSFADSVQLRWSQVFLTGLLALIFLRLVFFITNPEWDQFGKKFWYYLSFSILVYYLSINGYVNSFRFFLTLHPYLRKGDSIEKTGTEEPIYPDETIAPKSEQKKQKTVNQEVEDLEVWKKMIEDCMLKDKLFTDPTLTVSQLATKLNTHGKKVSQIIRQGYEMNFNDFVNSYRTTEVIMKMHAGEHTLQTLLGIALDCGFNSKSTFNRAFKRSTGCTPKEFLQQMGRNDVSNPDLRPQSTIN